MAVRKMLIRCRKCWKDVAVLPDGSPLPPCPLCGMPETYQHATYVKPRRCREDKDTDESFDDEETVKDLTEELNGSSASG